MKDADIRTALWDRLTARLASEPGARLFDELGVCEGRARIDLALVNGRLNGFEIKSDQDTLSRLDEQQRLYSKVFDRVTIVAHGAHLSHVFDRVPEWWGVTQAIGIGADIVRFIDRRLPADNPAPDATAIVQMLWRDEVIALLERRGLDRGIRSKPRRYAWERAASAIDQAELAGEVRRALKRRPQRRYERPV